MSWEFVSGKHFIQRSGQTEKGVYASWREKKKLLDLRLENLLKAEDFELKYSEISAKIEQNAMRLIELKEAEERRTLIKERVTEFRRLLQKNHNQKTITVQMGGYFLHGKKDAIITK